MQTTATRPVLHQLFQGRYELKNEFKARGGVARDLSTVMGGFDRQEWRPVVVKSTPEEFPAYLNGEPEDLFVEAEGDALETIGAHRNIVQLYDRGEGYVVLEYVDGINLGVLAGRCRKAKRLLKVEDVLYIMKEICMGLNYSHSNGVIHGDMNLQNVHISIFNRKVKILDFALALALKRMKKERCMGTPHYSAPEFLRREVVQFDELTDMYSTGCMFYSLLMLRLPLEGIKSKEDLTRARVEKPFTERLKVPHPKGRQVEDLVYAMVEDDREKRPQSMVEVVQRIMILI